ncbi:MAG: hypothetical protein KC621_25040, partial [Myxococcales bacterium]|nr:hypothetical protein [Myxococcales bacterium]
MDEVAVEVVLGDEPVVIEVVAGDALLRQLRWEVPRAMRWTSRGGPPGFFVHSDGTIDADLDADDVGRWLVKVRAADAGSRRNAELELRVLPAEGETLASQALRRPQPHSGLAIPAGACSASLGFTSGLLYLPTTTWEHLGVPETTVGASPVASGQCGLGRRVQVVAGAEATPWLSLAGTTAPVGGQLGLDWNAARWTGGLYVTGNAIGPGVGARLALPAGGWGGPELRLSWIDPVGARATLAWSKT